MDGRQRRCHPPLRRRPTRRPAQSHLAYARHREKARPQCLHHSPRSHQSILRHPHSQPRSPPPRRPPLYQASRCQMKRTGFTLLELLLANMLIAILLGAMLLLISSLSREQKRTTTSQDQDPTNSIITLFRRDLSNSESARPL